MVGNDIVVIRQMSLLVVAQQVSPSGHQGKKRENYGVSDSTPPPPPASSYKYGI